MISIPLETLKINHGIYPRYFTDEIMKEIGKISNDVVFELGNSDSQTATIYESYIKARNSYNKWTEMSDGLYINARKISTE